jgi:hypothetical protein
METKNMDMTTTTNQPATQKVSHIEDTTWDLSLELTAPDGSEDIMDPATGLVEIPDAGYGHGV